MSSWDSRYAERVKLLVEILPTLAGEKRFALKGGTAINLFEHDLPRLSVDVDLTWLPVGEFASDAQAIADALELKNVTAQHTRVEEIKNRKFDLVVTRAVAPLAELWKWSKPLLKKTLAPEIAPDSQSKPGLICLKGGDLAAEISESRLRPRLVDLHESFPEPYFQEKYLLYVHN